MPKKQRYIVFWKILGIWDIPKNIWYIARFQIIGIWNIPEKNGTYIFLKFGYMGYPNKKALHMFSSKFRDMGYSGNIPFCKPVHNTGAKT